MESRRLYCASHGVGRIELGTFPAIPAGFTAAASISSGTTTAVASSSLTALPLLNSLPGATKQLFLDFDGAPATTWGSYSVPTTPAYDQDSDPSTFSSGELSSIQEIWARVSEKFSPFNINVTTVDPVTYQAGVTLRSVIGGDSAWLGQSAGGVAYINSFTGVSAARNTVWVFPKNLGNGYAKYTAEASSHEPGHGFGLQHQSTYDSLGTKTAEYNPGNSLVAPIMGNSYSSARGLWYYGTSAVSSTSIQDDMAVISRLTNGFGYRTDDVGGTVSTASPLTINGSTVGGSGVISQTTDTDVFSFTTDSGVVNLSGNTISVGATLDLSLSLYASDGTFITSVDSTSLGETLSVNLAGGSYRLAVRSHGSYGDVGQYTISGTVVAPVNTVAAPSNLAAAVSGTTATLTWSDNSGNEDQFTLSRSSDPAFPAAGTTNIPLGANTTSYVDSGLSNGATYYYRVSASNASSTSDFSNSASATIAPSAPATLTALAVSSSQVNLAWLDVVGETGYRVERSLDQTSWLLAGTVGASATTYSATGLAGNTLYYFRVMATNAGGSSLSSPVASATTPAIPSPPAAPSSLSAVALSGTQVSLSWTDNAGNETGFYIERSSNGGKSYSVIGQVGANVVSILDASVTRRKTYQYRVRAFNSAGTSAYSNIASVSTPNAAQGSVPLFSSSPITIRGSSSRYDDDFDLL